MTPSDPPDPLEPYTGPIPDHLRSMFERANELIRQGADVYFKWTCLDPGCGARQTFESKNTFYRLGKCEECKYVTDLWHRDAKVNYLLIWDSRRQGRQP